jgi:hypothetical protein
VQAAVSVRRRRSSAVWEAGLASRSRMLARGHLYFPLARAPLTLPGRVACHRERPCTRASPFVGLHRAATTLAPCRLRCAHWRGVARLDGAVPGGPVARARSRCSVRRCSLGARKSHRAPVGCANSGRPDGPTAAPGATNRSPPIEGIHERRPRGQCWRSTKPPKQNAGTPERGPACSGREPHSGEPRPTNRRSLLSMIQRENVLGSTR